MHPSQSLHAHTHTQLQSLSDRLQALESAILSLHSKIDAVMTAVNARAVTDSDAVQHSGVSEQSMSSDVQKVPNQTERNPDFVVSDLVSPPETPLQKQPSFPQEQNQDQQQALDTLRAVWNQLTRTPGVEATALITILAQYDAVSVQTLDPEHYQSVTEQLQLLSRA